MKIQNATTQSHTVGAAEKADTCMRKKTAK